METKTGKKRNRNAIRSVNMIMDAYFELLKFMPMEKITVTAIVNKAGLNRSTFYAHFDCPDHVHKMLEQRMVDDVMEKINSINMSGLMQNPKPLLDVVAAGLESRMDYSRFLLESHPAMHWMESIKEAIIDKLMSASDGVVANEDKETLLINLHLFVGGYISLCRDYISGKIMHKPSELSESLAKTISGGLMAGIEH